VITVLVADDQPLARAGFRTILGAAPGIAVVGEAVDGEEAVEQARRLRPEVVLMDIQMPKVDGIEATRRLPGQKVIVLTTFGLDDYIVEALRAGAAGFLLKDAPVEELVGAVRAVAAGDAQLSPAVTRRLLDRVAGRLPSPVRAESDAVRSLTPRELEILVMLAAGRSNAEIAADLFVSEATVKTHVSNVLAKLGLRSRIQAVIFAYESGLITPGATRS
jgi:DNA-binding NarL/FixJ family response regulator